ncbi:DUF481 domain-containing protein [Poriferisphaera sp. WC338]|uniref:DUF481 domain-containing protein n=1 Tax=Poriferisphaera sp. WC338 TaxID=3425129 RepID=UPI003D8156AF
MKNGDRLTGSVKSISKTELVLRNPYLGEIKLKIKDIKRPTIIDGKIVGWGEIDSPSSESPVDESESKTKGEEKTRTGSAAESLGPVVKPREFKEKERAATQPSEVDQEVVGDKSEESDAAEAVDEIMFGSGRKGLLGTGLLAGWERSFQAGFSGSEGNSDTLNINLGLNLHFEDQWKVWDISSAFFYATAQGAIVKNQVYVQAIRNWKLPETKWYVFAQGRYDMDQFQAFQNRFSIVAGGGYPVISVEGFELKGEVGAGGTYNTGFADRPFVPEGYLGMKIDWEIDENQSLMFREQYFPDLSEAFRQGRTITNLDWVIRMRNMEGISLKFGLLYEYNARVDSARPNHNDLQFYGALAWEF